MQFYFAALVKTSSMEWDCSTPCTILYWLLFRYCASLRCFHSKVEGRSAYLKIPLCYIYVFFRILLLSIGRSSIDLSHMLCAFRILLLHSLSCHHRTSSEWNSRCSWLIMFCFISPSFFICFHLIFIAITIMYYSWCCRAIDNPFALSQELDPEHSHTPNWCMTDSTAEQ